MENFENGLEFKRFFDILVMNRVKQMQDIQMEALDLFRRKNADYGDAFAKYGVVGVFMRMEDKLQRLLNISQTKVELVKDESMRDTLLDLHNYAAMACMLLDTPRVIFIDKTPLKLTHKTVKDCAIGASEYQFYNLIETLSLKREIICYNWSEGKIDNVLYKPITQIELDTFYPTDIIVVQRFCKTIPEKLQNQKVFVWIHDCICDDIFSNAKNVEFIFNSEFNQKNYHQHYMKYHKSPYESRVIYNMMYVSEFDTTAYPIENKIVFASAWIKNLFVIIKLFRSLLSLSDVCLELMTPGYEYPAFLEYKKMLEDEFKERIFIHGPLKKQEYCKVLKSSICVLAPRFPETFGCVFAESYYLGVPVIADIHSGAVKEIINNDYIVDYDCPEKVHEKIQSLKTRPVIKLDDKFLTSIDKWEELLKEY